MCVHVQFFTVVPSSLPSGVCFRYKYRGWVYICSQFPLPLKYDVFFFLSMGITLRIEYQSMCGRVDRPSEPLWQMKVMLRRRGARRKAGNKQPDPWRTLKRTSEGKWGKKDGRKRTSEAGTGLSGKELFFKPSQCRIGKWPDGGLSFKCGSAAELWGLNSAGGKSFQNRTWAQTHFMISKERPSRSTRRSAASDCFLMSKKKVLLPRTWMDE